MHNIEHHVYPENVDKKKVFNELNEFVEHECWQEGGSLNGIRWETYPILESREKAEQWIKEHDRGWYDNLAVRFLNPKRIENEKTKELNKEIRKTFDEYTRRMGILYSDTVTSTYIGCKSCGSKLSRKHLRTNNCPVCRAELRPEHMLKSVEVAHKRYQRAIDSANEYTNKHAKKETCWLVKIEYHT